MALLEMADPKVEAALVRFITGRMDRFWGRVSGDDNIPFVTVPTPDPILQQYKFTNVYRVLDRTSQYMLRHVLYDTDHKEEDLIFRMLLFKTFNMPSTWEALVEAVGHDPVLSKFNVDRYCLALDMIKLSLPAIYSSAYMSCGLHTHGYIKKHWNHMHQLKDLFNNRLVQELLAAKSLEQVYTVFRQRPLMGDFLSYQYAIDLNYTPIHKFSENSFTKAGVGSRRGIEKLLHGNRTAAHELVIEFYTENFPDLLLEYDMLDGWQNLMGREPTMIDIQNCFCELDKYMRVYLPDTKAAGNGGKKIKNQHKPKIEPFTLFFPPWWNLPNDQFKFT